MGQEVRCRATIDGAVADGRLLLESEDLIFRGESRLRIRFADVRRVEAVDGRLELTHATGEAVFELGERAARWADRIRNPRTLIDKLDVKPGSRVALVDVGDPQFLAELRARTPHVVVGRPEPEADIVFVAVDTAADLGLIGSLEPAISRSGAIWAVAPRGREDLREADVLEAGREAGLVDTKVARFSDTRTAHKFVIPKNRR